MTDETEVLARRALEVAHRTNRGAWIRWSLMACFVAFLFWQVQLVAGHNTDLIRSQKATQKEGRAEYCQLFARNHVLAVRQLQQTRQYLARSDTDQKSSLTRAILRNLPQLREEVNATRLPHVCATVAVPPRKPKYPPQGP